MAGDGETMINEEGCLVYCVREWLPKEETNKLFDILVKEIKWEKHEISVGGKKVLQPREIYGMGNDEIKQHKYSGLNLELHPWHSEVNKIKEEVNKKCNTVFDLNSCLLNSYKDGSQYIGFHSDKEAKGTINVVVTLSLGGSRDFIFRYKKDKSRKIHTVLNSGDLIFMLGNTQKFWEHSVPKRSKGEHRISLTFRELSSD